MDTPCDGRVEWWYDAPPIALEGVATMLTSVVGVPTNSNRSDTGKLILKMAIGRGEKPKHKFDRGAQ